MSNAMVESAVMLTVCSSLLQQNVEQQLEIVMLQSFVQEILPVAQRMLFNQILIHAGIQQGFVI
jgi:hypothetical protein